MCIDFIKLYAAIGLKWKSILEITNRAQNRLDFFQIDFKYFIRFSDVKTIKSYIYNTVRVPNYIIKTIWIVQYTWTKYEHHILCIVISRNTRFHRSVHIVAILNDIEIYVINFIILHYIEM